MHLGLLGKSLEHSFSKNYFEEKFKRLKLKNYSYSNFELESIDELPKLLEINPQLQGLNVTIPYKKQVIPFIDKLTDAAESIGAVNCISIKDQQLIGYNTDYIGFKKSLIPLLKTNDKKALILGTGGVSQAIAYSLEQLSIFYKKVSRNPVKDQISYSTAGKLLDNFQIVINTTPLGTFPNTDEMPPLSLYSVTENHLFYDLIYNPSETRLLTLAKKKGARTKNGYEMLQLQAEAAWEIWNR